MPPARYYGSGATLAPPRAPHHYRPPRYAEIVIEVEPRPTPHAGYTLTSLALRTPDDPDPHHYFNPIRFPAGLTAHHRALGEALDRAHQALSSHTAQRVTVYDGEHLYATLRAP
jgi:hypothetical protein